MSEAEHNQNLQLQLELRRVQEEREYFKRLWNAEVEVSDGRHGKDVEILLAGVFVGCVGCVVGWLIWQSGG